MATLSQNIGNSERAYFLSLKVAQTVSELVVALLGPTAI